MSAWTDTAATVALLRARQRPEQVDPALLEEAGGASDLMAQEHGLLADELVRCAAQEVAAWASEGIRALTLLDREYPANLRAVHDRPPLLFVLGRLEPEDERAVAVIGSRRASDAGTSLTRRLAFQLIAAGYVVASGLAAGIDAAAHHAALEAGGRTLAVVGTGLHRCYPREHASLQQQIVGQGAVISRFWPDTPPSRKTFPLRNAVTSGISLATVVVEAGQTSGCRIQARQSLAQGRPVLLAEPILSHEWGMQLAQRPGVHVFRSADEATELIDRLTAAGPLVA